MDSLPRELIDEIWGYLPRETLRNCSLVSRFWKLMSQHVYFELGCVYVKNLQRWLDLAPQVNAELVKKVRHVRFHLPDFSGELDFPPPSSDSVTSSFITPYF